MANYDSITKITSSLTKKSSFFKNTPRTGLLYLATTKSQSNGGGNGVASDEFPTMYAHL